MKKLFIILIFVIFLMTHLNLNAQGWERSYLDSTGNGMGRCAVPTVDGSFYFTSDPAQIGSGQTAKIDGNGNVIWTTTIGGNSLVESADSGCVIASTHYHSFEFRKLSASGSLLWAKMYSLGGQHHMRFIDNVSDGGFIACGAADSNGFIIKLDMYGDTMWTYQSLNQNWDIFEELLETSDFGFVALNKFSSAGTPKVRITKIDSNGNLMWSRTHSPMSSETICQTVDNGFMISAGLAGVSKLDSLGNLLWTKSVGSNIIIYSIKKTFDNEFIATGRFGLTLSNDDIFLMKLDSAGNILWSNTYYNGPDKDFAETVHLVSDGGYVLCGSINYGNSALVLSTYIIRTDSLGNSSVGIEELENNNNNNFSMYPNPFNDETVCNFDEMNNAVLTIYNYLGKMISQIKNINGSTAVIKRGTMKSGMYFIKLSEKDKIKAYHKFIIID